MKVFAAHNPDSAVRAESSAGGVFSCLAEQVIADGGVVYGAEFDKSFNIVHQAVEKTENLHRLRGSKYAFSNIGSTLNDIRSDLDARRPVLFCGTPCQAAAVRKFMPDNSNLLIVEVVCHGAPEHKYWKIYLSEICAKMNKKIGDISAINFRDKRSGWKGYSFSVKFKDGSEFCERHDDNVYMRGFLRDYTIREACFKCPFKYPDSRADVTLGDFWGISQLAPQIDNNFGTTIVIARTSKGREAVASLAVDFESTLDDVARFNPAIVKCPVCPPERQRVLAALDRDPSAFVRTLKRYVREPFMRSLYLKLARLNHRILHQ